MHACLQVWLIHTMVQKNEPQFDIEAMQAASRGQYNSRLCSLLEAVTSPHGECYEMFRMCWRQLHDESLWLHLHKTEAVASNIFRFGLRPAAVIYTTVVRQYNTFPTLLFRLVNKPSVASTIHKYAADNPCLLDEYSRNFLARFHTPEALQSDQALLELCAVSMLGFGNIFDTERGHSSNARRSRMRPHTHVPALFDLSSWKQGWSGPIFVPNDAQEP
eukprot:6492807-Amphidinium_carterae.6